MKVKWGTIKRCLLLNTTLALEGFYFNLVNFPANQSLCTDLFSVGCSFPKFV